jgi:putative transposase
MVVLSPSWVGKWQRELTTGLDNVILSFYAQGQSIEDIRQQLQNLYGVEVSAGTSALLQRKLGLRLTNGQNRALHLRGYPIIYLDAIHYKVP